jgi:polysaccharide pyruvyl transferase WcaK-like protein
MKAPTPTIGVLHAFSRRNSGDALLVDESVGILERLGVPAAGIRVFALEADTFVGSLPAGTPPPYSVPCEPRRRLSPALLRAGVEVLRAAIPSGPNQRFDSRLAREIAACDGLIAVGGGYLRAGDVPESFGTLLNHLPQLVAAGRSDAPAVYLPQSIGPLHGPVGALLRRALERVDRCCVRDESSVREVGPRVAAVRLPDLAVLRLARHAPVRPAVSGGPVVVVARTVDRAPRFVSDLRSLVAAIERDAPVEWAVQVDGPGTRTDAGFYDANRVRATGSRVDVLRAASAPGAVVSVRLHGALESILAGWPAIHLSYQRKGWGAYADLGLDDYVHDARSFDPAQVAAQALALRDDPTRFWSAIDRRHPVLVKADADLSELVARALRLTAARTQNAGDVSVRVPGPSQRSE